MYELGESASFEKVAKELELEKRGVGAALKAMDDAYCKLTSGGHLIQRDGRRYVLTGIGERVGDELVQNEAALTKTLQSTATKHYEAWLPITTECVSSLPDLRRHVAGLAPHVRLMPSPRSSSDFQQLGRDRDQWHHAMFSACVRGDQIREGEVSKVTLADNRSASVVVAGSPAPFKVLTHPSVFPGVNKVSPTDLWDLDGGLMVPKGGAVRDLLDHLHGGWDRYYPYVETTDLEFGLNMLLTDHLLDKPALIVHGDKKFEEYVAGGLRLYDLEGAERWRAVTGMYRIDAMAESFSADKSAVWNTIWEAAANLWLAAEEAVA
ncbi:hypothetical protein [Serinicoccus sp. CNJ-927]|uniref:hypothetical protein n=1 Tax=Serinicoccus sp. CNJ-927 TaxID=1904970 RepID=UPI00117B818C|nr:hypothetical protein [Serinicoccus sp. CNJ-927]